MKERPSPPINIENRPVLGCSKQVDLFSTMFSTVVEILGEKPNSANVLRASSVKIKLVTVAQPGLSDELLVAEQVLALTPQVTRDYHSNFV